MQNSKKEIILLTGATGYVGGRMLPCLLAENSDVRCLVRKPENLSHAKADNLEVFQGDLLDYSSLEKAFLGVTTAYYFVHSLGSVIEFEDKERKCAENFAKAAAKAKINRIIYLGGLGEQGDLSPHLQTRQEVGKILKESKVQVIEFRASIIIGSGSLSFEMIRALVDRLPVMITPRWVRAKAQPISIEDVLGYLIAAKNLEIKENKIFEIGGPDVVSYMDIMQEYAKRKGVRRLMIPVPFLTPRLSSLWLGLITPLYARVGKKLIDSIRNDTLVRNKDTLKFFSIKLRSLSEAIERALINEDQEFAQTRWSDAVSSAGEEPSWGGVKFGSRIVDSRNLKIKCHPKEAFCPIKTIGGKNGWYYANWAWTVRGFFDLLFGGVGVRRGRSDPSKLVIGDTIDFWRIEDFEENRFLRLKAEMKVPGRAWLQFEIKQEDEFCSVHQTAIFDPLGVLGLAYWYVLYPVHKLIFRGMLREISKRIINEKSN